MLPHVNLPKECEQSIYVDADMLIKGPFTQFLNDLHEDTLFAACRHLYIYLDKKFSHLVLQNTAIVTSKNGVTIFFVTKMQQNFNKIAITYFHN